MIDYGYRLIKSFERRIRRTIKRHDPLALPRDFDPDFRPIFDACRAFTMTGPLRMHALWDAIHHLELVKIDGDIVECGVWRGGSARESSNTILDRSRTVSNRSLYVTNESVK